MSNCWLNGLKELVYVKQEFFFTSIDSESKCIIYTSTMYYNMY